MVAKKLNIFKSNLRNNLTPKWALNWGLGDGKKLGGRKRSSHLLPKIPSWRLDSCLTMSTPIIVSYCQLPLHTVPKWHILNIIFPFTSCLVSSEQVGHQLVFWSFNLWLEENLKELYQRMTLQDLKLCYSFLYTVEWHLWETQGYKCSAISEEN